MYIQNLEKILPLYSQDIERILTSIKGHCSVRNLPKMSCSNPNLDHVNINAYTKFGKFTSIKGHRIWEK